MRSIPAVLFVVLAACSGSGGGDDGDDGGGDDGSTTTDPKLVPGGGVTGAALSGTLHVHVIDAVTGKPVTGAAVTAKGEGMTSAAGLASFTDASLSGAQTVTATATGYAAATWIGVANSNVTLPLQPAGGVQTAKVKGTLSGLTNPGDTTHYSLGVVLYSFLDDPTAPENSITQPTSGDGTPLNTCIRTLISNDNQWELTTRPGKQRLTAVIVTGDTHGTDTLDDDTYVLIGYAVSAPITVTANQTMDNVALTMVAATSQLAITLPGAPTGLPYVAAVPELSLPEVGRIVFPLPTLKASGSATVLAATGDLAGDYEVVALATPSATAKTPFSAGFAHKATGTATIPGWLAPPTPKYTSGTFDVGVVAGAAFHTAQLSQNGKVLWNFTLLGNPASFQLPAVTKDPLAGVTGSITFAISAADVPGFKSSNFSVPDATAALVRASGAEGTFTK